LIKSKGGSGAQQNNNFRAKSQYVSSKIKAANGLADQAQQVMLFEKSI